MTRFTINSDGTYTKYITVDDVHYKITISKREWDTVKHSKIKDHIKYWKKNPSRTLRYGSYEIVETIPVTDYFICSICDKTYKSRAGYLRHIHKYHPEPVVDPIPEDSIPTNERTTAAPLVVTNNNTTNNNQHIHITLPPLHNFGDENPKWLTSDVILRAIQHIPTAIPNLIKEKHFNDKFPENQNVRLENKRSIKKRLKVFAEGRWCLKDRPELEFQLIDQIYDVLDEFIDIMMEDAEAGDVDDEASSIDKRIAHITRRIRASEMRSRRVQRVLGDWERFKDNIQDEYDKTVEPFKDKIDTFLLDNELRLEQLREKRAMLMG
jgi:hypothetical protein